MSMYLKRMIICIGVVTVLFSLPNAHAQPFCEASGNGGQHGERKMGNFIKELDLTAEQQDQMKKQRNEHREKNKKLQARLKIKMFELKQELEKETSDRGKIYSIVAEVNALQRDLLAQRVQGVLSTKEILTPEQFEKFKQKIDIMKKSKRKMLKRRMEDKGISQ